MSGPFEPLDRGWIFAALLAVSALVLTGITLSVMIDWRLQKSRIDVELASQVRTNEERVNQLGIELELRQSQSKKLLDLAGDPRRLESLAQELERLRQKRQRLDLTLAAGQAELAKLKAATRTYQIQYHRAARAALVGKSFKVFPSGGHRTYLDVRVTDADDHGLSISHRHGRAKLPYRELPAEWREQLQWSPLLETAGPSKTARPES